MGLDHGLTRKHYVKNWEHMKPAQKHKITVLKGGKPYPIQDLDPSKISSVQEDLITWRKANAIHAWFVANVQDGVDDCKDAYVSPDQLKELLRTVNTVLDASKLIPGQIQNGTQYKNGVATPIMESGLYIEDASIAAELLPAQPGFFFGSTDYDQYYYNELVRTKTALENVLKSTNGDLYYWSSW